MTLNRNEGLIRAAMKLHQEGSIPSNTYVIDLDSLKQNVRSLSQAALSDDLSLYYMTKQIGRSGYIGRIIEHEGIPKAVAVDIDEAHLLKEGECNIGNIGHLVQPSKSQWKYVLSKLKPEVVTLFSIERAEQLSKAAVSLGINQDVILRVIRSTDFLFPGQSGGFLLSDLQDNLERLKKLKGIRIIGITSFPVLELNQDKNNYRFTPNMETLKLARIIIENCGINVTHINAPGATSCYTIPLLKEQGVTHGEPGHAITGTTPLHAYDSSLEEIPSIVYVSEVSHMDDEYGYTISGGFYARSNMKSALFGTTMDQIVSQKTEVTSVSPSNIDYYGKLKKSDTLKVGDTVVYAFRTQIFATRAHVAFIQNVDSRTPLITYFQRRGN